MQMQQVGKYDYKYVLNRKKDECIVKIVMNITPTAINNYKYQSKPLLTIISGCDLEFDMIDLALQIVNKLNEGSITLPQDKVMSYIDAKELIK